VSRILAPELRGRFALSRDGRFVFGLTSWRIQETGEAVEIVQFDREWRPEDAAIARGPGERRRSGSGDTLVATGSTVQLRKRTTDGKRRTPPMVLSPTKAYTAASAAIKTLKRFPFGGEGLAHS
jgi:hypothetical protein